MTDLEDLPGSNREPLDDVTPVGPPDKPEIEVTVVLEDGVTEITALEDFVRDHDLRMFEAGGRLVKVYGSPQDMAAAFGTELQLVEHPELGLFRQRTGPVMVPVNVARIVHAVLGLDDRPVARMHIRPRAGGGGIAPNEVAALYGFPTNVTGAGVNVGVIELGGGLGESDLPTYWQEIGVNHTGTIQPVGVDGASSQSDGPNGADGEVMLDVEVIGGVAPGANQNVYFAPNTDAGFLDAIHRASQECHVVSISWGAPESQWTRAALTSYDRIFADAHASGCVITAAAGDNGSSDGVGDGKSHADFPSSSPNVVACGGTFIQADGGVLITERVWNDNPTRSCTGGGVSDRFSVPSYQVGLGNLPTQADSGRPGRVVPDVAGNADPQSGYHVRVDGEEFVIGGTSAVAPLWAGLFALLIERNGGVSFPDVHSMLYGAVGVMRDITQGNNGAYSAQEGFDACTGLGSPDPAKLEAALPGAPTPTPTPAPPPVTPPVPVSTDLARLLRRLQRDRARHRGAQLNAKEVALVTDAIDAATQSAD
jgi:kumamolisin